MSILFSKLPFVSHRRPPRSPGDAVIGMIIVGWTEGCRFGCYHWAKWRRTRVRRIFVNCRRTNDRWPNSMRFRAPVRVAPPNTELTATRHSLRQGSPDATRARCEAEAAAAVIGRLNAVVDENARLQAELHEL